MKRLTTMKLTPSGQAHFDRVAESVRAALAERPGARVVFWKTGEYSHRGPVTEAAIRSVAPDVEIHTYTPNMQAIYNDYALLKSHLTQGDPEARAWAAERLAGGGEEIEGARSRLTNDVLKPDSKARAMFWSVLLEIAETTAVFDRANACVVMQLKRGEGERGFLWISDDDLAALPQKSDIEQRASISGAYERILWTCEQTGADGSHLKALLEPRAPKWMKEQFALDIQEF